MTCQPPSAFPGLIPVPYQPMAEAYRDPLFTSTLGQVDMVIGYDIHDPESYEVFYGSWDAIQRTRQARTVWYAGFPIDFATDDPESLAYACLMCKGSTCYPVRGMARTARQPN